MPRTKKLLALLLTIALLIPSLWNESAGLPAAASAQAPAPEIPLYTLVHGEAPAPVTYAQGARLLCRMLGYGDEDAAEILPADYAADFPGISDQDDSLYLGILAAHGYLDDLKKPIDPQGVLAQDDLLALVDSAFPGVVATQEEADLLTRKDTAKNMAVVGTSVRLSAVELQRAALGATEQVILSDATAAAVSMLQTPSLRLERSQIERAVIDRAPTEETFLRLDGESQLTAIDILRGGDITIEGNGALGMVRIQGDIGALTVRATTTVLNQTERETAVTGPDGQTALLQPGEAISLVLEHYLVHFDTAGTPVESAMVAPGDRINFGSVSTEMDGAVFTAWYEDPEYTQPFALLTPVEGEMTLYARFVPTSEALTVTFETFDGRALEPLFFAPGEMLLTKPIPQIYTSQEGFTFSGWCVDEACTTAFGYTDPIAENMTLYAKFLSDEIVSEESKEDAAQLSDLDWQSEIPIVVPADTTLADLPALFELTDAGAGGMDPVLSFRETGDGFAIYGAYYEMDGETGFEPGSTFSLVAAEGAGFADFEESVRTLAVSIYREEVEILEFKEDLAYLLWDLIAEYTPFIEDEENPQDSIPGTLLFPEDPGLKPGETFVMYDGLLEDDDNVDGWREGSFDGYVLFAHALACVPVEGGVLVSFDYADPAEYIETLEVHTTREYNVEELISDEQIARMKDSITRQIMENDELRAQLLIAVITSPDTQALLDEQYGQGVYSLASSDFDSMDYKINLPEITVKKMDNRMTVELVISASASAVDEYGLTILSLTPKLTIREEFTTDIKIDGGFLWLDTAITYDSIHTIRLEITATAGSRGEAAILNTAIDTLHRVITPDGIDTSVPYQDSITKLMRTIESISAAQLSYFDLYAHPLLGAELKIKIGGVEIITLTAALELVAQFGMMATVGFQVVVTEGRSMGFNYNFLKFKGSSYNQKLHSNTRIDVFVIGKLGVRVGIRQTFGIELLSVVKVSISGGVFVYAELTGIYFYTKDLGSGAATNVGGLYFEVGIDAEVDLNLAVRKLFKRSWSLWGERWPLYSTSLSSELTYPDLERMEGMWTVATEDADLKSSYGFDHIPMHTYSLFNGKYTQNQLLWGRADEYMLSQFYSPSTISLIPEDYPTKTLQITNLRAGVLKNLEKIGQPPGSLLDEDLEWVEFPDPSVSDSPLAKVFYVGKGGNQPRGTVYFDEEVAADHLIVRATCDVLFTYEDQRNSAVVKKVTHTFPLERNAVFTITTVNARFVLVDWCARAWGLEPAAWDGTLLAEQKLETKNVMARVKSNIATGEVDLGAVRAEALARYSELSGLPMDWLARTASGGPASLQYSNPKSSNFCFLTPANRTVTYDIRPSTETYGLTFYLYAYRFPGYTGEITYLVKLSQPDDAAYGFSVSGKGRDRPMDFLAGTEPYTWQLLAKRAAFDGTDRPLQVSVEGSESVPTGLTLNGREPTEVVELIVDPVNRKLDVIAGRGIERFAFVTPEMASGDLVRAGTTVTLSLVTMEDFDNAGLISSPPGLPFTRVDDQITFTMPAYDQQVTLVAYPLYGVEFLYNHADLGLYRRVAVAENEEIARPAAPYIAGMTFRDWYESADCSGVPYAFGQSPTDHMTLYADWTCNVTVDFGGATGRAAYLDESGAVQYLREGDTGEHRRFTYSTLRVGERLHNLVEPTYDGHVFMGWYLTPDGSGDRVDLRGHVLTGGVTLYAGWAKILTITYDPNHGGLGAYYTAMELAGQPFADLPDAPERQYYSFIGWYTDPRCTPGTRFDPAADRAHQDMTLYAGWDADPFALRYDLGGGAADNPSSYTVESRDITLRQPTRTGYAFAGWTGTGLSGPTLDVTIPAGSLGDRSYAATWTPVVYRIDLDPGLSQTQMPANPTSYTIESPEFTLHNPSRAGYDFGGWTGTDLPGATLAVIIRQGSTGDRQYTGTWTSTLPENQILLDARNAIQNRYEYPLDGYDAANSLQDSVRASIDGDPRTAPYAPDIVLTCQPNGAPVEDPMGYAHPFLVRIEYTGASGIPLTEDKAVTAYVNKRAPEITELPEASKLLYGRPLGESGLTGGRAAYGGARVEGGFAWADGTAIPKSAANGQAIYPAVFQPTDTATYRPIVRDLAVWTQTGVLVELTSAQSREYDGTRTTTGTFALWDGDNPQVSLPANLLNNDGTYTFARATPGEGLTVTFEGYTLSAPLDGDGWCAYGLVNTKATALAAISKATLTVETPPHIDGTVEYQDELAGRLTGGNVTHLTQTVRGTWSWGTTQPNPTVTAVGLNTLAATFTPDNQSLYHTAQQTVQFTAYPRTVRPPTVTVVRQVYTGTTYASSIAGASGPGGYSVQNASERDAGNYRAILTLDEPALYRWPANDPNTGSNGMYGVIALEIAPATPTTTGTPGTLQISYDQKLGMTHVTNGAYELEIDAGTLITRESNFRVTPSMGGAWAWDLSSLTRQQPLTVGTYPVDAVFSYDMGSQNGRNYYPLVQSFQVQVMPVTPDLSSVSGLLSEIHYQFQNEDQRRPLSDWKIIYLNEDDTVINPITGSEVDGTWSWVDGALKPEPASTSLKRYTWHLTSDAQFVGQPAGCYAPVTMSAVYRVANFIWVEVRASPPNTFDLKDMSEIGVDSLTTTYWPHEIDGSMGGSIELTVHQPYLIESVNVYDRINGNHIAGPLNLVYDAQNNLVDHNDGNNNLYIISPFSFNPADGIYKFHFGIAPIDACTMELTLRERTVGFGALAMAMPRPSLTATVTQSGGDWFLLQSDNEADAQRFAMEQTLSGDTLTVGWNNDMVETETQRVTHRLDGFTLQAKTGEEGWSASGALNEQGKLVLSGGADAYIQSFTCEDTSLTLTFREEFLPTEDFALEMRFSPLYEPIEVATQAPPQETAPVETEAPATTPDASQPPPPSTTPASSQAPEGTPSGDHSDTPVPSPEGGTQNNGTPPPPAGESGDGTDGGASSPPPAMEPSHDTDSTTPPPPDGAGNGTDTVTPPPPSNSAGNSTDTTPPPPSEGGAGNSANGSPPPPEEGQPGPDTPAP